MKFNVLTETPRVGREYQHLEDLVFVNGSAGALEAADILDQLGNDTSDVSVKFDGNPTLYWGRNESGQFVLVGKNGWGRNMSTSADDLYNFITNTGTGEKWRKRFGADMSNIFAIIEQATPQDFRGYVYGDILYHPGNSYKDTHNSVVFTPNKVTYTVRKSSNLGKRIISSEVAVVVHSQFDEFGSKVGTPVRNISALTTNSVVVLGPSYVTHTPSVDLAETDEIRAFASKYAKDIDMFLAPVTGLSNMKRIIYTYVNQTSKAKNLAQLDKGFFNWLNTSKVSTNKQAKIANINEQMPKALPAIFKLVVKVMKVKDHIIDQLDSANTDVTAFTNGEQGGEGYVAQDSKIKLVPRTRWQP